MHVLVIPKRQGGMVLYVSLMLLVALSLLGVAGLQLVSMQERMVENYYRAELALQNAEKSVRDIEAAIEMQGESYPVDGGDCIFDPLAWARAQDAAEAVYVRRLGCEAGLGGSGNRADKEPGERGLDQLPELYEITVLSKDAVYGGASTLIQTTYIPHVGKDQFSALDRDGDAGSSGAGKGVSKNPNRVFSYGRQSWRQLR